MKKRLINLNLAAGIFPGWCDFLKAKAGDTDIFCFQELFNRACSDPNLHEGIEKDIYQQIRNLLGNDFSSAVAPRLQKPYMNGVFWKKSTSPDRYLDSYLLDSGDEGSSINMMEVCFDYGDTGFAEYMVYNTHGFWQKGTKGDCSETLQQSKFYLEKMSSYENWKDCTIFCGDFNLMPDTESVKMIERAGLRNLITEYGITNTRTYHCKRPEKFADYIFVGNKIRVHDFKVLEDVISDHAPLYLEFSVI